MADKTTTWSDDILALLLNGTGITNIADNTASSPLTALYCSLHNGSPGASGNQSTSEVAYAGYSRIAISRNNGSPAWTVSGGSASPNANIVFPTCSGGTDTGAYVGIGVSASGSGGLLLFGPISPNISISSGVPPILTTASTVTET